jgi:predicted Zn-dependent protease
MDFGPELASVKRFLIFAGVAVVTGGLGLWFFGRPAYRHYKEQRFLERARQAVAKGDYRNASLSARQTLILNSRNLEAWHIQANLAEVSRSPLLLECRRKIAELDPSIENKLMLASTALRVQNPPYPLAAQTLDELGTSAQDVANYHAVKAELALKLQKTTLAESQYEEATRLEPTNEIHQLNLAVLRSRSTNASVALAARGTLERLRTSTNLGAVALRWLIAQSAEQNDWSTAEHFSSQLLADPHAVLDDRLQHLTILQRTGQAELQTSLDAMQKGAATNALEVYAVSSWMAKHSRAADALNWLSNCPPKVLAEQPVPLALVECYMAKNDWPGLENFLEDKKWGDLEFLRQAFLSRAAVEQKQSLAADVHWRAAVREAGDRLGPLEALLSMATTRGWDKPKEDLLWLIGQRFPRERWALGELVRLYDARGNTRGLNRVYATIVSYDSKDFQAKNNLAATSMLLRLNLPTAHELAKEVYRQHPEEGIATSTYAYSLHLQGRTKEGLAAMEKLKTEALETPPVALYYGVLLAAAGETNKASKYLELANHATLLPEEKTLIAETAKAL